MAVRRNQSKVSAALNKGVAEAAKADRKVGAADKKYADKAAKTFQKAMESFHPDCIKFFKDKLSVDIQKLESSVIYDLLSGKLTRPLDIVVRPLAYDRDGKKLVEMPLLKGYASIRAVFPMEGGKQVALDEEHKIFLQTVPCIPFIYKSEGPSGSFEEQVSPYADREDPVFSEQQVMALEGVGIDRSRLFGGRNHLTRDEKCALLEGEPVQITGSVKTDFGIVNVSGEVTLSGSAEKPEVSFEPSFEEERSADKVIDLLAARNIGNLELDFFRRNPQGKVITNANGLPILNEAGANIVKYGMAMEPVWGYLHSRKYDAKTRQFVDSVEKAAYQVTAVNGNLFASRMKEIKCMGQDGKADVRYEISQARVSDDGKVYLDGKVNAPLEFASDRDREEFLAGRGGVVKNAVYHDFKNDNDLTYEAFVVADNTRAGFAHQFTPDTSAKLIERRGKAKAVKAVKKQNFGFGF